MFVNKPNQTKPNQSSAKDVVRFQMNFAMLAKTNMDGLKKRDRKGRRSRKKKHAHA